MELLNSEYGNFIKKQNERVREKYGPKQKKKAPAAADVAFAEGGGQFKRLPNYKKKKVAKPLKKRVAQLEKKTKQNYATHVFKSSSTFQPSASQNQSGYTCGHFTNRSLIEAALAAIPIVNTAAVGTMAQLDMSSLPNPTKWHFKAYAECRIRNNYLYPCEVRIYVCKPKVQTGNSAEVQVSNGLNTHANPSITASTLDLYPSDAQLFGETYKTILFKKVKLQAGDEIRVPWSENMVYDQEYGDNVTSAYTPRDSRQIMVRVTGCLGHDSTTTSNIGFTAAKLDCVILRRFVFKFPALAPNQTLYETTGLSSMSTAVITTDSAEAESSL